MRARVANLQLQKDATELSDLCASVPHDMDGVRQGLLAQDLAEKLKHLEKSFRSAFPNNWRGQHQAIELGCLNLLVIESSDTTSPSQA
jgi:hypothetical protein